MVNLKKRLSKKRKMTYSPKINIKEIDLEEDSDEVVENKLCQFYIDTFSKAGFEVE